MKKEGVFLLIILVFTTLSLPYLSPIISAADEDKVELAYSCLEAMVNLSGCSKLTFEEKAFSYLAIGKCGTELSADNSSNRCWPKSGCKIKSTAQAILALNKRLDTSAAERWLLDQSAIPTGIDWYLEIESLSGETTCTITPLDSTPRTITIREDKTISSGAGSDLTLSSNGYWLKINPRIYNREISISCGKDFITTLLFVKSGSSTIHVSEEVSSARAGGTTTEIVNSVCFAQNGVCNYEGSLWAAFVLSSLGHEDELKKFMPYLISLKDNFENKIYIPESFLYYMTGKFRVDLLSKQKSSSYWEESGNRYYDTALALLPFAGENPVEKSSAKSWLLSSSIQQKTGCWNNGNIRDTAFILYSLWKKNPSFPVGECEIDRDCPSIDCKRKKCENGICKYENDGSCTPGGVDKECTSDKQCPNPEPLEDYCYDKSTVYKDVTTPFCDISKNKCSFKLTPTLVKSCSKSEVCEKGKCIQDKCGFLNPCNKGYDCVDGKCIPEKGECDIANGDKDCETFSHKTSNFCSDNMTLSQTLYSYYCNEKTKTCEPKKDQLINLTKCLEGVEVCEPNSAKCILKENICKNSKGCKEGYDCVNGICTPKNACEKSENCSREECKVAECIAGVCLYDFVACKDNDGCCPPGCNHSKDNDCKEDPQCITDSNCTKFDFISERMCGGAGNRDVYVNFHNYTCKKSLCEVTIKSQLVQQCSSSQSCKVGKCTGGTDCNCVTDSDCDSSTEICKECVCKKKNDSGVTPSNKKCTSYLDCKITEDCLAGICIQMSCTFKEDCRLGAKCVSGKCVEDSGSDCIKNGYFCRTKTSCTGSDGKVMQDYVCGDDLLVCCNVEAKLLSCSEEGGKVCAYDEICMGGAKPSVTGLSNGEVCCVGGTCSSDTPGGTGGSTKSSCASKGGVCRSSFCDSGEEESLFACDYSKDVCCIPKSAQKKSKTGLWILLILLIILIALAVLGIVFRDKVKVKFMEIKDKLSGKKSPKKPGMPQPMGALPQNRISPRRILPPGQSPATHPQNPRFPMRSMGPPISGSALPPQQQRPPTSQQPRPPTPQKPASPTSQQPKPPQPEVKDKPKQDKVDEKPKDNDLEDVLKKLKEMGDK